MKLHFILMAFLFKNIGCSSFITNAEHPTQKFPEELLAADLYQSNLVFAHGNKCPACR